MNEMGQMCDIVQMGETHGDMDKMIKLIKVVERVEMGGMGEMDQMWII